MTNSKTTKRALYSSVVTLLLCFTMLLGTTFAWFTDSAASGSNVITAGNLDMVVEYTLDGENWKNLDGATDLFQKGLWEPGHTEVVLLKITNNGSLALKYAANMNIVNETIGKTKDGADIVLSEILTVSTCTQQYTDGNGNVASGADIFPAMTFNGADGADGWIGYQTTSTFKAGNVLKNDKQLQPKESDYIAVKVDMADTVGDEANHDGTYVPTINFGINVLATQYTYENDSFGNQYDKNATYPELAVIVENEADFLDALKNGGNIKLGANISFVGDTTVVDKSATIDLNGYTLSSNRNYKDSNESTTATLHIKGADTKVVICGNGAVINNYKGNLEEVDLTKSNPNTFAIYVSDGADLTIMGGTYKSFGSAVYVGKGSVNIQGGFFESDTSVEPDPWYKRTYEGTEYVQFLANVVNCNKGGYIDGKCTVEINGGTFVNEDPSDLAEGWELDISHVADGYKVVSEEQENGDKWYTVVAE